jgi:hypothetical protein
MGYISVTGSACHIRPVIREGWAYVRIMRLDIAHYVLRRGNKMSSNRKKDNRKENKGRMKDGLTFPVFLYSEISQQHSYKTTTVTCTQQLDSVHTHTYLLTPWSRVLLEKLTSLWSQSRNSSHVYGIRRFFTVLTSSRHLSLSWANSIQSPQTPPTSWRSIFILSSHLRLGLPNGLFPKVSPPTPCAHLSHPPYAPHALPISFSRF